MSKVSSIKEVRAAMVREQRKMSDGSGIVMDGRDIGTVVFPKADLKIFLTASMDVRVTRRMNELSRRGKPATADEVRDNIIHRDFIDSNREDSPLRKAQDAFEIDTTEHSIDSQVQIVVAMALALMGRAESSQ